MAAAPLASSNRFSRSYREEKDVLSVILTSSNPLINKKGRPTKDQPHRPSDLIDTVGTSQKALEVLHMFALVCSRAAVCSKRQLILPTQNNRSYHLDIHPRLQCKFAIDIVG